jgi:DNA (cytosine-5)-methyltransferase 1
MSAESAAGGHLQVAPAIVGRYGKGADSDATDAVVVAHTLRAEGFDASEDGTGRGTPLVSAAPDADGVRASSGLSRRVDDPRPDGPRYAECGNAVTVPVAQWIGERIMSYEQAQVAA